MGFVNKVMLLGNTTREPELRQLSSGTSVCDFGLATNRTFKIASGEERTETLFVDCTAFGRLAEVVAEYCPKGRAVFIEGRLHYEAWDDAQGNRRSKLSVIAENVQFVGGRDGGSAEKNLDAPARAKERHAPSEQAVPRNGGKQKQAAVVQDVDLPF